MRTQCRPTESPTRARERNAVTKPQVDGGRSGIRTHERVAPLTVSRPGIDGYRRGPNTDSSSPCRGRVRSGWARPSHGFDCRCGTDLARTEAISLRSLSHGAGRTEPAHGRFHRVGRILDSHVLPKSHYRPTCGAHRYVDLMVPLDVASQLRLPVAHVDARRPAMLRAPVPEAPIDENCQPRSRKGYVHPHQTFARTYAVALAESHPACVQRSSEGDLRLRIGLPIAHHHRRGRTTARRGVRKPAHATQATRPSMAEQLYALPACGGASAAQAPDRRR
jgi:hypothetical protein